MPPNCDRIREQLASEMEGRWLGPMPVDLFFKEYLQTDETLVPLPGLTKDPFSAVPTSDVESERYAPFINAIEGWIPHLHAMSRSMSEDTSNDLMLEPDVALYDRGEEPVKTDFTKIELWIEFKTNAHGVAFRDPTEEDRSSGEEQDLFTPSTVEGWDARGQLAHYAEAQHGAQFRHFSYSIVVEGDCARILRWDPSATVVTAAFNFRENPEILADFLWRFDHFTPKDRGHDQSVRPAHLRGGAGARVREKLQLKADTALFEYDLPGLEGGHGYGPRPPYHDRSLVSRCTRSLPIVWIPESDIDTRDESDPWSEERVVFLKDTWRFLSNRPDVTICQEHEIYAELHQAGTPNIPELVVGGDVPDGRTRGQEMAKSSWLCVLPVVSPYQHYRLVLGTVGCALTTFRCTKELVMGVLDAMKAHWHAFCMAKLLHGDVSVGNILLTDDGRGLLIDWELAKRVDERGSSRTGTWAFMSANLLQNPGKIHTLEDDIESFLHVLAWTTLRFVPAVDKYSPFHRSEDMVMFNEHKMRPGGHDVGGKWKYLELASRVYPSEDFKPRQPTPLYGLLKTLSSPFVSLYTPNPPNEVLREEYEELKRDNPEREQAWHPVYIYDYSMERLKSSLWFISTIEDALIDGTWPSDDNAVGDLPMSSSFARQEARKLNHGNNTYQRFLRSMGFVSY